MRKIREVLRLAAGGHTQREIGRSLGISHATAAEYLRGAVAAGLGWPLPEETDEAALEQQLFPVATAKDPPRPLPDWTVVQRELKTGVQIVERWSWRRCVITPSSASGKATPRSCVCGRR